MEHATGEWITFSDHDDTFEPDAFKKVRKFIEDTNVHHMVTTNFREYFPIEKKYGQTFETKETKATWTHGKWYNKDNVIDKYNISYYPDLDSHEDLYFNALVLSKLRNENIDLDYSSLNEYTYKWHVWPNSVSRSYDPSDGHIYIETYLKDYIFSSTDPYIKLYRSLEKSEENEKIAVLCYQQIMSTLLFSYFYYQGFIWMNGYRVIPENIVYIKHLKTVLIEDFGMDDAAIINYIYLDADRYDASKIKSKMAIGPFVEVQSFRDFILNL